jgi:hypothetical protein
MENWHEIFSCTVNQEGDTSEMMPKNLDAYIIDPITSMENTD